MIKANELRILNTVEWNGVISNVIGIGLEHIKVEYVSNYLSVKHQYVVKEDIILDYNKHMELLKPIPLTEDILLKCGFLLSTPNQYIKHQHWYNETTDIEFNHLLMCSIYEGNGHVGVSHVKYLHQLQNLHYALTGQELAIKM